MSPCQHGVPTKFLPIVSPNHLGPAASRGQVLEYPPDVLTADGLSCLRGEGAPVGWTVMALS
jgi:hypothetical protein